MPNRWISGFDSRLGQTVFSLNNSMVECQLVTLSFAPPFASIVTITLREQKGWLPRRLWGWHLEGVPGTKTQPAVALA